MGEGLNSLIAETMSGGTGYKLAVRLVATANHARSGLAAIDGVTPGEAERVLLAGQTSAAENGIYYASAGSWTRALDLSKSSHIVLGSMVPVLEGSVNALRWYQLTSPTTGEPRLNVTPLTFERAGILTPSELPFVLAAQTDVGNATDAATPNTLALRDADGDCVFRHMTASQVLGVQVLQLAGSPAYIAMTAVAAASVPIPAAGVVHIFADASNATKISRKDSGGAVTVIGTETA